MKQLKKLLQQQKPTVLTILAVFLALATLFGRAAFPEYLGFTLVPGLGLLATLGALIHLNRQALRGRTAAYGLNSTITILLVVGLVGVANFLITRYPLKWDTTRTSQHTLSDQTVKLIKGLGKTVKAVAFTKVNQREQIRPLLDNYRALSTKFEVEYVDPDREPTRTKQLGIRKLNTIHLAVGPKDSRIEDATEEKLTNALIKLLKDKNVTLCAITGHGEKSFASAEGDGYEAIKKQLASQSYEVKDVNLMQEGKVPESCDALAILGPTKSFFEAEIKVLREYLLSGGRAIIGVDLNLKGSEYAPELSGLLAEWHVRPLTALVVDPLSRMLGVDASVPIVATYSKDHAVTKDFQLNCFFPFLRPLEILPGAPTGLTVTWLGQTTPKSWGIMDLGSVAKGEVRFNQGKDKAGPLNAAVAIEGKLKDSKGEKKTRLAVFGSAGFAGNAYSRYGGNVDFFMNATSWVLEDESLISIRKKDDEPTRLELTQKQGIVIFLLTLILIPVGVSGAGVFIWWYRKKL